jgi:DTW domain-containing protein YfiP
VTACTCGKPPEVCVCDRLAPTAIRTRVLVLQHPQEQDRRLGTVPLLERGIGAVRRVGLSWPNLAAAWGSDPDGRWAVVWPMQLAKELPVKGAVVHVDRAGEWSEAPLDALVALDGSWSQAKALWWRNPWLLKLDRIVVRPTDASIYGRMRREPRPGFVSTLEAVADALVATGEAPELRADLRRAMRTMVQRARDAGPEAASDAER